MLLEKIIIGVAIVVSYFLQTSVEFFRLGDLKPDFLLLLTVYFAMHRGEFTGLWVGFFGGLLQDINLGIIPTLTYEKIRYYLGINILPKSIVGYLAGKGSQGFRKDSYFSWMALIFVFSLIKGILLFFLTAIFHGAVAGQTIVTVILPESIYNSLLSIVWFKLLFWAIPPIEVAK